MIEIESWSPAEVAAARGAVHAAFVAGFAMAPDEATGYVVNIGYHAKRPHFRFLAAREGGAGPILGFVYGYTSLPGQWFHDLVRDALGPDLAATWLADAYEVVEFAVIPEARGQGLGGRLHDAVLAGLPHEGAILSTRPTQTAALALYARRGWRVLRAEYFFPGNRNPYLLLGLDLRGWQG